MEANDHEGQEKLEEYLANVQAYKEEMVKAHIEKVNSTRDSNKNRLQRIRMHRFLVMEEAGQPMIDIKPEEENEIHHKSALQRKKAILAQSGVLKYLQPFYENSWNHKINMSSKRVKHYVDYGNRVF